MAAGDTLAGDSVHSCVGLSDSGSMLEGQQTAADSHELSHMADSSKMDVDAALPAALLTDMCMFVARSVFITISSSFSSSKMSVVVAANSQTTPGKDHASNGCCRCRGSFSSSKMKVVVADNSQTSPGKDHASNGCCRCHGSFSSSSSIFLDVLNRWKPKLSVSYGDSELDAMNRPKPTRSSINSSNGSSVCSRNIGCCSTDCCRSGADYGSGSIRCRSGGSHVLSGAKRNSSSSSGVWSRLEVVCCVVVASLVTEVCSAACLGKVNCSTTQFNASSQAHVDYLAASTSSNLSIHMRTGSGSHRKNHSLGGVLVSTQDFVLQNTVLTSQKLYNPDASQHDSGNVAQVAFLSATKPAATTQESDEDLSKIIGVVIPFVCVILLAVILCVAWKLCRKYKCCNNEACLQKCSALCDSCMSAPYAFQVPAHVKVQSQMSRDSTGLTLISQNRLGSVSQVHRSAGNIVRPPHSKLNLASHRMSSTSLSRHSSSRSGRQVVTNAHSARSTTHSPKHTAGQVVAQPQKVAYASVHQNDT